MKKPFSLVFILIFTVMNSSCAHKPKYVEPTPGLNEQVISTPKTDGAYYTILDFEKGTTKLTEKSKDEIKQFLNQTKKEGVESHDIKILTFPDNKVASKKDVKLADKRANEIIRFMKKNLEAKTDLLPFNMASRASVLNEFLESDDPNKKKVFEKTGVITQEGEDLAALKDNQEGKALIIRNYE